MPTLLAKVLRRARLEASVRSGCGYRRFAATTGLRVLTYHGIIPDHLAGRPWVPSQAVKLSAFERHMALLARCGQGLTLSQAWADLESGGDGPRVAITFDDGLADNFELALPVLRRHGHRATFFVTTGYMGTGELLLNDRIRLLGEVLGGRQKEMSLNEYWPFVEDLWATRHTKVDADGLHALRLMTWAQVDQLAEAGMEIGAHTVDHVILARESQEARRRQIMDSIAIIRARYRACTTFAYPNGLRGDYGPPDVAALNECGVRLAVTQIPGWNTAAATPLELHRQPIGLHDTRHTFLAQLYGAHSAEVYA